MKAGKRLQYALKRAFKKSDITSPLTFFSDIAQISLGERPVSVEPLSPKGHVFVLQFPDGRRISARLLQNRYGREASPRQRVRLHDQMQSQGAAVRPVIGRYKNVVFSEFTPGNDLRESETIADTRKISKALHSLHGVSPQKKIFQNLLMRRSLRKEFNAYISFLEQKKILSAKQGRAIRGRFSAAFPRQFNIRYIHDDFAPQNIVRTPNGRIIMIDDLTIKLGIAEMDLGKFIRFTQNPYYFLRAYPDREIVQSFLRNKEFWDTYFFARHAYHKFFKGKTAQGQQALDSLLASIETRERIRPSGVPKRVPAEIA
ncbi:MAG: hypothetical protein J4215_03425 [Candidatus Diapherotrites archaeon]|uniref:BSD domain-containing protein n=1 Tax=Candidatus Iainarchaeum sp. TaxID=3101447 RepID=A0A8T4L4X0_9ARCH|nr:hypothetical protein [Candidatus Diapherotrites archaeon]